MCLAIPGRIIEFVDEARQLAKADISGVRRTINVALVAPDGLEVGNWVLIHVGFALSRIDEDEARRTTDFLRQIGEAYDQELAQIADSGIE